MINSLVTQSIPCAARQGVFLAYDNDRLYTYSFNKEAIISAKSQEAARASGPSYRYNEADNSDPSTCELPTPCLCVAILCRAGKGGGGGGGGGGKRRKGEGREREGKWTKRWEPGLRLGL